MRYGLQPRGADGCLRGHSGRDFAGDSKTRASAEGFEGNDGGFRRRPESRRRGRRHHRRAHSALHARIHGQGDNQFGRGRRENRASARRRGDSANRG